MADGEHGEPVAEVLAAGPSTVIGDDALDPGASAGVPNPDFRLDKDEELAAGLRRIAREQIDFAAAQLRAKPGDDPGEPIHEARKAFKRLRALVRLARDELGDETYRRENAAYRDMGRRLSGARDAQVLVETLDKIRRRDGALASDEGLDQLGSALAREYAELQGRLDADKTTVLDALADLEDARERLMGWTVQRTDVAALEPGLRRIYTRGRKAHLAALKDRDDEHLHELRKRVKDLWHAAQILEGQQPQRMGKLAKSAHKLADHIGEDHDLAVLTQTAAGHAHLVDPDPLQQQIDQRRDKLQKKAASRAKRLYGTKPRAFVKHAIA